MADRAPAWPESALWREALRLYGAPGVAAACLRLQDGRGADVPLLLLACWLTGRGVALDPEEGGRLAALAARWRPVIGGLREARRALKPLAGGCDAGADRRGDLRERVKAAELDAEHELLLALGNLAERLVASARPSPALAFDNLRRLGQPADGPDLAVLLTAADGAPPLTQDANFYPEVHAGKR